MAPPNLRVNLAVRSVTALFLVIGLLVSGCSNSATFDPEIWKHGNHRQRGKMVRELIRSEILVGKTKEEVTDLLGPPDSGAEETQDLFYIVDLGYRFGSKPWTYQFHVKFSSEHDVVETVWYAD